MQPQVASHKVPLGLDVPAWLAATFAGHDWQTLRSCSLRVCADGGAGLDLQASEFGYLVEGVEATPGQDPQLCAGSVVIEIGGLKLMDLEEDALEAAFGSRFQDAAPLTLADAIELQRAAVQKKLKESADTVEVYGLVMQSLPARKRRRRTALDNESEVAVCESVEIVEENEAEQISMCMKVAEIRQFEYMDHTADVILHTWGRTLSEAFSQVCVAFFSYMTELKSVELVSTVEVEAKGKDMLDLLYHLLDEFLFVYGSTYTICRRVQILEFDERQFRVRARGFGERFDLKKHPQGTEIKAITMHQMKILTPNTLMTEEGIIARKTCAMEGGARREGFPFECYVLVDI